MVMFNTPEASDWIQQYYEDYFRNFMSEAEWGALRDEWDYQMGMQTYATFTPPEGVTYSPEAMTQMGEQGYQATQEIDKLIYQVAGIPESEYLDAYGNVVPHPTVLVYGDLKPYYDALSSEQQAQIFYLLEQRKQYEAQMLWGRGVDPTKFPEFQLPPEPPPPQMPAWSWAEEVTGIKPGERIRPGQFKIPSGQMMKRMTPSEMAGLSGLLEWSAGRAPRAFASAEDYWKQAMNMLPQTSPRGTVRWATSPFR